MTTESTDIALIDKELADEAKQIATALVGMPVISTKGGQFTFPDGHVERGPLDLVIVGARRSKQLWALGYDEAVARGLRNGVTCAAISDAQLNQSMEPFKEGPARPSNTCDNCPQNKWERNAQGKRVKVGECKDSVIFAVMAPDLNPPDVYLLRSSATGIGESIKAIQEMKSKYGHPVKGVGVFSFVLTPKGSPRLSLKAGGPNPAYREHAAFRERATEMLIAEPQWYQDETPQKEEAAPSSNTSQRAKRPSRSAA